MLGMQRLSREEMQVWVQCSFSLQFLTWMTLQKCGIFTSKIQMHHKLGEVGRSFAVNYYYATVL